MKVVKQRTAVTKIDKQRTNINKNLTLSYF